jgi:oxygen-dependent protoporphyrinogen oxidase
MAQPFNQTALQPVGDVFPIAEQASTSNSSPQMAASVAANGVLAYLANGEAAEANHQLSWRDRSGKALSEDAVGNRIRSVALSPDGKTVATTRDSPLGGPRDAPSAGSRDAPLVAPSPVFGALRGGYRVLLDALADAARADLRLGTTVRGIEPSAAGWLLVLGPTTAPEALEVDAVVLAVPAPALARLLQPVAPAAADAASGIELASSVVVALAFREEDVTVPATSGALVAAGEPLSVKGVTHSSTKWAHLAGDGLVRLRASLGRFGEAAALQADDATLVDQVRADLAVLDGIRAAPVAVHVQRWGGGLPQYAPGHVGRVATLEAGLPDGVAVAGAALHGVGVPACIGTGRAAADRVARSVVRIG